MRLGDARDRLLVRAPLYSIRPRAADALVALVGDALIKRRGHFISASAAGAAAAERFRADVVEQLIRRGLVWCRRRHKPFRTEALLTADGRWYAATILADRADALIALEAAQ